MPTNSLDSITHSTKQLKSNSAQSLQNYKPVNMQIPTATNVFSQQMKDYKMKHNKKRSSHASIPNTNKQSSSQPPQNENKLPDFKTTPSFDQQLKDYRSKHNRQYSLITRKYQPIKYNKETSNQQAVSSSKEEVNNRKIQHNDLTSSQPSNLSTTTHSLDEQLKDYRLKHNNQCSISTTKYQPTKRNNESPACSQNQQVFLSSKQMNYRKEHHYNLKSKHNKKTRANHKGLNAPKPINYRFHNQRQHSTPPSHDHIIPYDFPPNSPPFRVSPYPPIHPRSQEWLLYLKYVSHVTKR